MPTLVIGLDIGTTSTIGILIDLPDKVVAVASRPVRLSSPHPGWAEEDPEECTQVRRGEEGVGKDSQAGVEPVHRLAAGEHTVDDLPCRPHSQQRGLVELHPGARPGDRKHVIDGQSVTVEDDTLVC